MFGSCIHNAYCTHKTRFYFVKEDIRWIYVYVHVCVNTASSIQFKEQGLRNILGCVVTEHGDA
jgi:hypothetical protein